MLNSGSAAADERARKASYASRVPRRDDAESVLQTCLRYIATHAFTYFLPKILAAMRFLSRPPFRAISNTGCRRSSRRHLYLPKMWSLLYIFDFEMQIIAIQVPWLPYLRWHFSNGPRAAVTCQFPNIIIGHTDILLCGGVKCRHRNFSSSTPNARYHYFRCFCYYISHAGQLVYAAGQSPSISLLPFYQ